MSKQVSVKWPSGHFTDHEELEELHSPERVIIMVEVDLKMEPMAVPPSWVYQIPPEAG